MKWREKIRDAVYNNVNMGLHFLIIKKDQFSCLSNIRRGLLNFLFYGQLGEFFQASRSAK